MHLVVAHPWRQTPKGEITLLLDPDEPGLHLGRLPEGQAPETGDAIDADDAGVTILTDVTLHTSPDERVPEIAGIVAELLFEHMPAWLDERICELLNGIHGFGTSRNPRGPAGKMGMDHPLAPIGIWGPAVEKVGQEVRRGRFSSWQDVKGRLDPVVTSSIEDDAPDALRADILDATEQKILLREPL